MAKHKAWSASEFDAAHIERFCDVIMKGGVTSGVVYPLALCRLATRYVLKNIGGTSVGAIAASLAAAAEYRRRQTGSGEGYVVLSQLPDFLEREGTLRALFAADAPARPLLAVALNFVGPASFWRKLLSVAGALLPAYWWVPLVALIVAALASIGLIQPADGRTWTRCIIAAVVAWLMLSALGLPLWYAVRLVIVLGGRKRDFGWCHGHDAKAARRFAKLIGENAQPTQLSAAQTPPLTDWLDACIAQAAGRPREQPLTFGELWEAQSPPWHPRADGELSIDFRMVTTCLTLGRPVELPFASDAIPALFADDPSTERDDRERCRPPLYFRSAEMRRFFPAHIVDHLERWGARSALDPAYHRFPAAHALPLVVAARLSMSFPILFSALPLHAPDLHGHMQPVWFSDGGLTSNFPIHLFDNPLTRWPTFAIDLLGTDPQLSDPHPFLESAKPAGTVDPWNRFASGGALGNLLGFASAIVDTMRTWQDTSLGTLPGNLTRTVGIRLPESEGGLNLNMPPRTIANLLRLGGEAGDLLVTEFAAEPDTQAWRDHRWTRYRATMGSITRWLNGFRTGYAPLASAPRQASYHDLILSEYPRPQDALYATRSLRDELERWATAPHADPRFTDGEPEPMASLRMRPDTKTA
jgi:hypothetical protein